jgi:magnesium chelatase family protein
LDEVIKHLRGESRVAIQSPTILDLEEGSPPALLDFSDIKSQETAKRGLEIAAAGGHNILMVGPAGTGKTMLARALASILPPLSLEEVLEVTRIHSVTGVLTSPFLRTRPFRHPHHTASYVAMVGGGTWPKPGEITLAHRGVLFVDEFPELEKRVIEALRQPLEDGFITVSRSRGSIQFPARFTMICAMNPCPCGNLTSKTKPCVCSPSALLKYQRKISGPIADRIDLWVEVPQVEHDKLSRDSFAETSKTIQERVIRAREIQKARFAKQGKNQRILTNSEMSVRDLKNFISLGENVKNTLTRAAKRLDLSARAYHRVIKIARTIADLEGAAAINEAHILEALQYRPKQNF